MLMMKQIRCLTFGRLPPGGTVFIMVYMLSPELVESDMSKFEMTTRFKEHVCVICPRCYKRSSPAGLGMMGVPGGPPPPGGP